MKSHHDDDHAEHPAYALGAGAAMVLVLGTLVWLVASHQIVYRSLVPSLWLGSMWKWLGGDYGNSQWNLIVQSVQRFAPHPADISFVSWASFITVALRPIACALMLLYLVLLVTVGTRRKVYMRRFKADELMRMTMNEFTGVAPVVAIRKQIAKDQHPLWRSQVSPEEVFTKYRVPAGTAVPQLAPVGAAMVQGDKFHPDVARNYFTGVSTPLGQGRLGSTMLGRQIVNLPTDAAKGRKFVFADRMSPEGKTLLALWASVAFGAEAGREEFCRYRDKLNLSAYGTRDGIANLTVAQPLYEKFRAHPMLTKIFAVHHWEHTVLFQLLSMAQRRGRFTTAEVLWLRPLNRVMYFALNSRGSATPHTEAASTFTMHAFEQACARNRRLPLYHDGPERVLRHVIYVEKAVDALAAEWAHWSSAIDENDDWWVNADLWTRTNDALLQGFQSIDASTPTANLPGAAPDNTEFDRAQSAVPEQGGFGRPPRRPDPTDVATGNTDLDALMSFSK
jgi:hypothetical protein